MGQKFVTITELIHYSSDQLHYQVARNTINRWMDRGLKYAGKLPFEWRGGRKVVDTELYEKFLKQELYSKPESSVVEKHGAAVCKQLEIEQTRATAFGVTQKEAEKRLKSYGFKF